MLQFTQRGKKMSQKERIKAEIDILKALIIAFLTAIFGMFGWALIHYESMKLLQGVGVFLGVCVIVVFIYLVSKRIIKNLDTLERLE